MAALLGDVAEGQKQVRRGFSCQALVCAGTSETAITEFITHITQQPRFKTRNCLLIAYRFADSEGYEQTEEETASLKLLHLLQRMGVENILVGVVLWTDQAVQTLGCEMYRTVVEAARTLVETLHSEVVSVPSNSVYSEKKTLIQLPPISYEQYRGVKPRKRALNLSLDCPYSAEPGPCLPDKDYESNMNSLTTGTKQVNTALIFALQKHLDSPVVTTLLRLLLLVLQRTARKCVEPVDLLVGRNLKIAMNAFRPSYLPIKQIAKAQNLQQKVDSASKPKDIESEIDLLSAWTKTALRLCSQPTLQPLTLREEPPEPTLLLSTATSVRPGRYGTPTQFVFDGFRSKNVAKIASLTRKKEVPKTGLEALTDIILKEQSAEEAWEVQPVPTSQTPLGLDTELENKLLEARKQQLKQEERINRLVCVHLEDLKVEPQSLAGIPDADVYSYIEKADLKELPTGLLMAFAGKLKERRRRKAKKPTN